jgi:lysophospholipase L1-like esterase
MKSHRRFLIVASFLSIVLLFSLVFNYVLYKQAEQYYIQLNALRLDPLGLDDYKDSVQPESGLPLVVFFGDSRAASWPAPDYEAYEFVNRGIGAQTSIQVLERFDDHIKLLKPEVIIIQVGINDLKTIPLFPENRKTIIANCEKNIQRIVDQSIELGAAVILTTIFPVGQVPIERRPFWSDDVGVAVDEVNTFIRSLAGNKVIVFDTYPVLVDNKGNIKSEYSQDLLHLTDAGYAQLNVGLVSILENLK